MGKEWLGRIVPKEMGLKLGETCVKLGTKRMVTDFSCRYEVSLKYHSISLFCIHTKAINGRHID